MKECVSLTMVAMDIGKKQFFSYHSNGCYKENILYRKHKPYRYKIKNIELNGWVLGEVECCILKNVQQKGPKDNICKDSIIYNF